MPASRMIARSGSAASGDVVLVVLAKREEHGARAQEDSRDAQPPGARRGQFGVGLDGLARHARSVAAPD